MRRELPGDKQDREKRLRARVHELEKMLTKLLMGRKPMERQLRLEEAEEEIGLLRLKLTEAEARPMAAVSLLRRKLTEAEARAREAVSRCEALEARQMCASPSAEEKEAARLKRTAQDDAPKQAAIREGAAAAARKEEAARREDAAIRESTAAARKGEAASNENQQFRQKYEMAQAALDKTLAALEINSRELALCKSGLEMMCARVAHLETNALERSVENAGNAAALIESSSAKLEVKRCQPRPVAFSVYDAHCSPVLCPLHHCVLVCVWLLLCRCYLSTTADHL